MFQLIQFHLEHDLQTHAHVIGRVAKAKKKYKN